MRNFSHDLRVLIHSYAIGREFTRKELLDSLDGWSKSRSGLLSNPIKLLVDDGAIEKKKDTKSCIYIKIGRVNLDVRAKTGGRTRIKPVMFNKFDDPHHIFVLVGLD